MLAALQCPPHDDLSAFLLGQLPHDDMASVAGHVESCSTCQAALDTLDGASDPMLAELRLLAADGIDAIGPLDPIALAQAAALVGPLAKSAPIETDAIKLPPQLGAYRLGEKLGQGGMGAVYLATHAALGKQVALKILARDRMADADAQARFQREIRAVGRLQHANIVGATDAGAADGWHFLVMEYVAGWDLSRIVRTLGSLPIGAACEALRQTALALQHVHEHRLVHRDVKPSNLMLTRDGQVKLLDLGLAVLLRDEFGQAASSERDITRMQQVLGTIEYMSPEQLRDSRTVDIRADLYSLGCTAFKLLTGGSPFQAAGEPVPTMQLVASHLNSPAPDVRKLRPDVPRELAAIIARLLSKRPEDRYATPGELAAAIAPLASAAQLAEVATHMADAAARPAADKVNSTTTTFAYLSSAKSETNSGTGVSPVSAVREAGVPPVAKKPGLEATSSLSVSPPHLVTSSKPQRRLPRSLLIATAAGAMFLAALAAVILIVRNTRIEVPDGSQVEVAADGTVRVTPPERTVPVEPAPKITGSTKPSVEPAGTLPLDPRTPSLRTAAGAPLSRLALVARPTKIEGVDSWSLETVGHRSDILAVAFSPDSKLLATAGKDTAIRLWNVTDGTLHSSLLGHSDEIRQLLWSRDGRYLVSREYKTCWLWDVEHGTRRLLHEIESEHNLGISGLGWSAEPNQLIVAWGASRFDTLDVADGQSLSQYQANEAAGFHAGPPAFSPDGRLIAVGDRTNVFVLDSATGKRLNTMPAESDLIYLSWSHDSKRLAIGTQRNIVTVWEALGKQPLLTLGKQDETSAWLTGVGWSHDDRIVYAHGHAALQAWDAKSGQPTEYPARHSAKHNVVASPDGQHVAASTQSMLELFTRAGSLVWSQAGHRVGLGYASWSPQGEHLAHFWGDADNNQMQICISRAADGAIVSRRPAPALHDFRWTSDGQQLALAQDGGDILFFGITGNEPLRTLATGHKGKYQIRFTPNGKRLATGDLNRTVKIWTLDKTEPDQTIEGHLSDIRIEWSPDGQHLAVAGHAEPTTMIYDCRGELVARCINPATTEIQLLRWSPDSRSIVTGGPHLGELVVFDAATGDVAQRIDTRPGGNDFQWTDPQRLAFFYYVPKLRWWDFDQGRFESPLANYGTGSAGSPVAPDRRTMASPQYSGPLFVWDFTTGERHGALVGLRNQQSVLVDASGHYRLSHPSVAGDLRIVADIGGSQRLFTLATFARQFGWKSDPASVKLSPEWATKPQPEGTP